MYLKVIIKVKCLEKMNNLTISGTNLFFLQMLSSLILNGRIFQARLQTKTKKNRNQAQHLYSSVNTFIMLDWGASKQLHSTFMNTGSCLVSAFMQCSCFYIVCDTAVEWCVRLIGNKFQNKSLFKNCHFWLAHF